MSREGWIDTQLGVAIEFRNGKSSPDRKEHGENPVFGGNGIIGYTSESNSDEETIILGRVGAYCGSVYFNKGKCWVTDNAIIGKVKENHDGKFLFYLLKNIDLNDQRSGSSQPLINQSTLNALNVKLPLSLTRPTCFIQLWAMTQSFEAGLNLTSSYFFFLRRFFGLSEAAASFFVVIAAPSF